MRAGDGGPSPLMVAQRPLACPARTIASSRPTQRLHRHSSSLLRFFASSLPRFLARSPDRPPSDNDAADAEYERIKVAEAAPHDWRRLGAPDVPLDKLLPLARRPSFENPHASVISSGAIHVPLVICRRDAPYWAVGRLAAPDASTAHAKVPLGDASLFVADEQLAALIVSDHEFDARDRSFAAPAQDGDAPTRCGVPEPDAAVGAPADEYLAVGVPFDHLDIRVVAGKHPQAIFAPRVPHPARPVRPRAGKVVTVRGSGERHVPYREDVALVR
mmetsp:Transcript_15800/g.45174  ORF Transcript_15800/g.45174 Transcript_15800/m.45174 type:complete len:274 (+) Transcript_15800:1295-2116(+)